MRNYLLLGVALTLSGFNIQASDFESSKNCMRGRAGNFPCEKINLLSRLTLRNSGHKAERGNDIWGWTDPLTKREYALMGMSSKTAFVDITNPAQPVHLGDLKTHTENSIWRDIKVYKDHAFIVSEASNHGMQVFDLTQLRDVNAAPVMFEETAHYDGFGSAHNIAINEETGFAYSVGTQTCDAGMHIVDIRNPRRPVFSNCVDKTVFEDVGDPLAHGEDYTHDVQCVVYRGPDSRYTRHEICFCSNADTVNIVDVSDKTKPVQLSVVNYSGLGYVHQGWATEDHRYFFLGDELDEVYNKHKTKTYIWDLKDLEKPVLKGTYFSSQKAIDHNMYVKGNTMYQANYDAGLRVIDLAEVERGILTEVAFFDTEPDSDKAEFIGAWSVYPYFESGNVVVSNISGDLFVLRPNL